MFGPEWILTQYLLIPISTWTQAEDYQIGSQETRIQILAPLPSRILTLLSSRAISLRSLPDLIPHL